MLVLRKCMFFLLLQLSKTITNTDIYFDHALGGLLCLVCCDLFSIAHNVVAMSNNNSPLSLVSLSYLAYYQS